MGFGYKHKKKQALHVEVDAVRQRRLRSRGGRHLVAARNAAIVAGTKMSAATPKAVSACASCPQSFPMLISCWPVSMTYGAGLPAATPAANPARVVQERRQV
jgi:hypothetical protein